MIFLPKKTISFNFQLSTFNYFLYLCTVIWCIMRKIGFLILLLALVLAACGTGDSSVPKPYAYFRIGLPDTAYQAFDALYPDYPYTFALSQNAEVQLREDEPYWINIYYPCVDATIHCSYKPVRHNLRKLTDDALEFVYRNASFANSIPEREYEHPEAHVYGVLFDLEGNTASSCQFFITDSVRHFFRASVYCNCMPNADSLAPVNTYLRRDILRMIETFEWKNQLTR